MSLSVIQRAVDEYITEYTNGYFPPLSMLARPTGSSVLPMPTPLLAVG
jgi:hypothetical protein